LSSLWTANPFSHPLSGDPRETVALWGEFDYVIWLVRRENAGMMYPWLP
jgi:hypothetical protein